MLKILSDKKDILKIIISAILLVIAGVIQNETVSLVIYIIGYVIVGAEVVIEAIENILKGEVFDENFLMTVATIGAFFIGEYPEAVMVMLLFGIGELFEEYAEDKSRKSISELMDIRADYANIEKNGNIEKVSPEEVKIGDTIVIRPGEKIPLDGIIKSGSSNLDTKALTGETIPKEVKENDEILSGCINLTGMITVEVTKEFGESTVSKILDLVENASSKKANTENFITKFSKIYTPAVVIIALAIAILPGIITGDFGTWIYRALTFLVVSCPCALVISVPLSFFGGIGGASKIGVLVKGSNYLEAISKVETIVFDKTGTLTKGVFSVQKVNTKLDTTKEELIEKAAYVENYSNHPIAISIKNAYGKEIETERITETEEISGKRNSKYY